MTRTTVGVRRFLAAVIVLGLTAGAGIAAEEPQRGKAQAVIVEAAPAIDGVGQTGTWAKCPALPLGNCTDDGLGALGTTARVLMDATRLYVSWQCADADTDGLAATASQRDGNVWADDCVELFITGDAREGMFHFAVNSRGTLYDARRTAAGKEYDESWSPAGVEAKAAVQKGKGWTATLSVPLKEIGAFVGAGQTWVMNLNRTRPARGDKAIMEWSWAVMGSNDYHAASDYGQLAGVTVPNRPDGVTRESAPPAAGPVGTKGTVAGSVTVYMRIPEIEIRDDGKGLAKAIDLTINGSRGLKVAFLASSTAEVERVTFNMSDARAKDNTTSKAYRFTPPALDLAMKKLPRERLAESWRGIVEFCDRFRYNGGSGDGTVAAATEYTNLRFHGSTEGGKGVLRLREFCIYRGEDTTPPTAPTGLSVGGETVDATELTWKPATDNVGVARYVISRAAGDGKFEKVAETVLPKYAPGRPGLKACRYRVLAVDFQDNMSAWSAPVTMGDSPAAAGEQVPDIAQVKDRPGYSPRVRAIHRAGVNKVNKGTVLCFGDSLTAATVYPREIEAALGRYRVEGRGYPSMKTSFGRERIEKELAEVNPEFCLILFGTNNGKGEKDIAAAMEDLKAIAAACEKHGTVPVFGTIPPRGFNDPASKPEARYNEALVATCRAEHIPVAYNFEAFQASGDRHDLIADDGVHTHKSGFAVFARSWARTMDEVLFAILDRPEGEPEPVAAVAATVTTATPAAQTPADEPRQSRGESAGTVQVSPGLASPTSTWPPRGQAQKVPITRDNWTSAVGDERFGNNGEAPRLKLKGQQEHSIFDFDPAALKGKVVTGALLHVRCASPKDPFMRVTVSTLASQWVEGTASGYKKQQGSSCFDQAELGKRDWAFPGSTLMDVAYGRGNTIWRFAEATTPDAEGWQTIAVEPDVVAARAAGLCYGLAAYDDVGNVWSYLGGKFKWTTFPNRFVHSRDSRGSEPWLEVWTSGADTTPPPAVTDIAADTTAVLPAGEALVTWVTPADTGGGKTLGFQVSYEAGDKKGNLEKIPRYLVPMAGPAGKPVRMHVQDLPFAPGAELTLTISAVDSAGNVGPAASKTIKLSATPRVFPIADSGLEPFAPSEDLPVVGGLKVAVVDEVDKISPKTGKMIPDQPAGYKGGNHLWSAAKKLVRLQAARNEAVCFQVNLEGVSDAAGVTLAFPAEAGLKTKVYRLDCVTTSAGPLPDVAIPLAGTTAVPPKDDPEAAGAKNVSLLCEVYVPHAATAGAKAGKCTITSGGQSLELAVDLTVWDFTLPNKLSFVSEMNAYGTADPKGGLAYYRLAHEHRLCMNRLYYPWAGTPSMAPKSTAAGLDFAQWDKDFAGLLDGSAFADLPRGPEPVDVFYLPFNENWPADVYKGYSPSYWIDSAFKPAYAEALAKGFKDFAAHAAARKWDQTIFELYFNNKVYYKEGGWQRSAAPWIFDEPVNTQDFWALRWYGLLWHSAVDAAAGAARCWFRGDVSYSQYGRNMFWGVMDLECLGGADDEKVRMKNDEQVLFGPSYFTEYGSANDPATANLQPVLWSLKAWSHGAVGVLPWQTIGEKANLAKGEATALFIPVGNSIEASIRLKAFRRGEQDVEYLTLLGQVYDQPLFAVAGGIKQRIDLAGKVHKTSESDAGTIRFDQASPAGLWKLRTAVAQMVAAKKPPYQRCVRAMPTPPPGAGRLPEIGYVRVAPPVPASKPQVE